jgi:hypothetical protein
MKIASAMLRHAICWKLTDDSEVLTASIIRVNFYETTLRNIPEDGHHHTRHLENLKSHLVLIRTDALNCGEHVKFSGICRSLRDPGDHCVYSTGKASIRPKKLQEGKTVETQQGTGRTS